ncbi:MAG: fimbrillin family protein [Bacteroidales bacterium]|nr:fimbrillin family protein [Bacteroidales bacterium]
MKLLNKITLLLAALGFLASCSSDITPTYTVGDADNAIVLRAGISDGGAGVMTRTVDGNHAGNANGGAHVPFNPEVTTQLRLRVDGTWLGKGFTDNLVSKPTTATIGAVTGNGDKHNVVSFSTTSNPVEQLYWDDYGSADPANIDTPNGTASAGTGGRNKGLTIYGVAIEGQATAPAVSDWKALSWTLDADQTSGWATKDLLTSNNIRVSPGDGTYKFDDYIHDLTESPKQASNLLEFTHAMTKITVNLTAGEGFPGYETGAANAKFQAAPTVKLLGFNYTGTVNVESKTSTPTSATTTNINTYRDNGAAWVGGGQHTSQFTALVFPGNQFSATIADDAPKYTPTSSTDILELNADGNIYKVTAAQLVKAIAGTSVTGTTVNGTLEQAKNYILNITVNKTDIEVTATIKNWVDVPTEDALPKINVAATYGYTAGTLSSTAFTNNYDLFRSTVKATGYDEDANSSNGINPAARYTESSTSWDKTIYWPNHQTHYFFRGVYPQVGAAVSGTTALANPEAVTTTNGNDVIAVANATYTTATYPSDLAIAIPRGTTPGSYDETCKESGHTSQEGICATEGVINMNFEYAMSKVEVRLKSSKTDGGHIDLTKANTKVEIIGGYSKARIKLSDGLHDAYADADKGDYTLHNLETPVTDFHVTTRDAIVPQLIGDNVIFRITVITDDKDNDDPSDDETDVYECKVNLINVKNSSPATPVTEWAHGKHYIYELDLNKTAINVVATLKDWVTITANDNVWF